MDRIRRRRALSLYDRLLDGWNRQDADAFAATFAPDGNCVGFDGSIMNGRDEIAATLRGIFASHRTAAYVAKIREVRPLGADAVLIRSVVGMTPPDQTELNPAVNAIQSLVLTPSGGELVIALLQTTPAAFHGRPELALELTRELTAARGTGRRVVDPDDPAR